MKVKENSLTGQMPYDKVLINAEWADINTGVLFPQRKASFAYKKGIMCEVLYFV